MPSDKRSDDRLDVLWHGYLMTEDGTRYPCEIRDVSEGGALITCDATLPLNQDVMLTLEPLGDFAGRVKWRSDQDHGLWLLAGPDLALKKFAEPSGAALSEMPQVLDDD